MIAKPKFRHELKYLISMPDYALMRMRLNGVIKRDSNTGASGEYMIRSLYFDDYAHSAYYEKDAGVYARKKYRIRLYNYSDNLIHLERKSKQGQYIWKESASITRAQVEEILAGNYAFLEKSTSSLMQEFYYECTTRILRPRVIVDYEREPFVMEAADVRITFDKHVRAGVGIDLFDSKLPTLEVMPGNQTIMEVKFTEFMPRIIRRILPMRASEQVAASKYVMCCDAYPDSQRIMERVEGLQWKER